MSTPRGEAADYYSNGAENTIGQQGYPPPQQSYPPNEEQKYQQQPPQYGYQPPQNGAPPQQYGEKQTFDQAFKIDKPKWNDLWAGILFIIVFLGYTAISGIALHGYSSGSARTGNGIYGGNNDFGLDNNTIILFALVLAVAIILSYSYVWLARAFTKQFIWITGILNVIFAFVTAIYMLARKYYSGGIVFLIFAVFAAFCFYTWIKRIPFSVLMLQTSVDVSKKFGHVYLVSFIGGFLATAFGAWYSVTLVAIYVHYEPGNNPACNTGAGGGCSSGKVIGLIVAITFAMYWISEWLKNTIHVTISGVYGSWYFCQNDFPKGATRGALKRALTYSFGSISFGSLIVAIINFLRQLCSVAQRQEAAQGDMISSIVFCILGCLIGILDWAVQFLNRYAFSHIALYGKAYIPAAKDTWTMIKQRGIDALVNECLLGPCFTMGSTCIAYACALLSYLYLIFTNPAYNTNGEFTPVVVAFSFLIGLQIANIFTTPLSSGIDTIFVACAWDPEVLKRDHGDLYAKMISVYPQVQQAIHA